MRKNRTTIKTDIINMLNKKVLLLGLLLLAGGADCSAQISVLNKIKNKAKQVVKKEISP